MKSELCIAVKTLLKLRVTCFGGFSAWQCSVSQSRDSCGYSLWNPYCRSEYQWGLFGACEFQRKRNSLQTFWIGWWRCVSKPLEWHNGAEMWYDFIYGKYECIFWWRHFYKDVVGQEDQKLFSVDFLPFPTQSMNKFKELAPNLPLHNPTLSKNRV